MELWYKYITNVNKWNSKKTGEKQTLNYSWWNPRPLLACQPRVQQLSLIGGNVFLSQHGDEGFILKDTRTLSSPYQVLYFKRSYSVTL